jgi:uncharacterized protein with HEPN domain
MLSEKESGALRDIVYKFGLAEEFSRGHTFESLAADTKTLYALVRTLEIISEASPRVPDAVKARHHHIEWREMAAAGNFYRHNYEDVTARPRMENGARPFARTAGCDGAGVGRVVAGEAWVQGRLGLAVAAAQDRHRRGRPPT